MMVMPGSHSSLEFKKWVNNYGNLGNLFSPDFKLNRTRLPNLGIPYAIDNGKYSCWEKGYEWKPDLFLRHCDRACRRQKPLWIVAPDFVMERERTIEEYYKWEDKLRSEFGAPLAFAVQDGMTVKDAPTSADVIFVGGSTEWKLASAPIWCENFKRVHLARVNTWQRLWFAHSLSCESCDGTGWFQKGPKGEDTINLHLYSRWQAGLVDTSRVKNWPWINPVTRLSLLNESLSGNFWKIENEPLFATLT